VPSKTGCGWIVFDLGRNAAARQLAHERFRDAEEKDFIDFGKDLA